jgi:DnaJ-domain-containing protein 1
VELIAALFMLGAGGALAVFVVAATAVARAERNRTEERAAPTRDAVAASLLFHILTAGGIRSDEALREIRRGAGIAGPVTTEIDVANWAESYARVTNAQQRSQLLETAVQLVARREGPIPVRQYAALLDLSFGLGFHSDALARLRESYGFEYIDHAKTGRPRSADRGGSENPLFSRDRSRIELLAVLGLSGTPTRQELGAAYRKLVAQHHPDRFHGAPEEAQTKAAARFIEITRAYEELLLAYRD